MNQSADPLPIQIRKMTGADLRRVIEIDQCAFSLPWPASSFHYELEQNSAARTWVAEIIDADGQPFIVGMIVGWLIVDEIHIATVAADPAYRHLGIGKKLMLHLLREAYIEGARTSFLEVRRGNSAARQLYTSMGYIEDGVRPHYYADNHEDAILMSLPEIKQSLFDS